MGREQKIKELGCKLLEPMIEKRLDELQAGFSMRREDILAGFQKKVSLLCQEAGDMQQLGQKADVRYLSFSYLQHCVYTQKYEIRLDLYDEFFYLDSQKIYQYWDVSFIFQFFETDMEYFKEHIRFHIPVLNQLQEYEEKEFALWYIKHYYKIAESFLRDQITAIYKNQEFERLRKAEDFMVVYGGYMEEQCILFQSGTEGSSPDSEKSMGYEEE